LITDINMPKITGLELTKMVKSQFPEVKVLALSMLGDKQTVSEMLGFDTSTAFSGAGMQNMKSRVEYINGNFEVDSSPGRGTTISVEVKI
jgi:DNA-binding NarL/FixJ family response regulator